MSCAKPSRHAGGTDLPVLHELLDYAGIETSPIYAHLDTSRLPAMVHDLHSLNEARDMRSAASSA